MNDAENLQKIRLPCRIGDTVYAIRNYGTVKKVQRGIVSEMYFVGKEMKLCIVVKNVCRGEWGKNIFATEAECENETRKTK